MGRIPGLYEHIRAGWQELVRKGDPRLLPDFTPDLTDRQRQRLNETSPLITQAKRKLDKMSRSEPVRYPCAHVGGNSFPQARNIPWIADRLSREMWVAADDRVSPAAPHPNAMS